MVTTLDDVKLSPEAEGRLKALRHDINCVGIALSKCLGTSQAKIVLTLINNGIIGSAEDLALDGSIPKAANHFGWKKLYPTGATWADTRGKMGTTPVVGTKYFCVNWGTAGKEGFDQRKIFHAFAVEIGSSTNSGGKTTSHIHVKGGNIKDYHKELKAEHWVSAWKVE